MPKGRLKLRSKYESWSVFHWSQNMQKALVQVLALICLNTCGMDSVVHRHLRGLLQTARAECIKADRTEGTSRALFEPLATPRLVR